MLHLWPPCLNSAQQHLSAGTTSNTQTLQTAFKLPMFLGCCFVSIYYKRAYIFFLLSALPPSFSCPSSCWPKKTKDFKIHFLRALCEHWESEALRRLAQEAAFHHPAGEDARQTSAKHTGNLTTTYCPSGASRGPG